MIRQRYAPIVRQIKSNFSILNRQKLSEKIHLLAFMIKRHPYTLWMPYFG